MNPPGTPPDSVILALALQVYGLTIAGIGGFTACALSFWRAKREMRWVRQPTTQVGLVLTGIGVVLAAAAWLKRATWVMEVDRPGLWYGWGIALVWAILYFPGAISRWLEQRDKPETSLKPPKPLEDDVLELYKIAVDTRKLELDLFWKRSGFFWGFLAVTLAGYFAVKDVPHIRLILSHVGVVASFTWWMVNRGSKYWHENWEAMVRLLEGNEPGLFGQTAHLQEKGTFGAASYSVSRITIFFSAYMMWLFIGLALNELVLKYFKESKFLNQAAPLLLLITTATAMAYASLEGVSGSAGRRGEGSPERSKQNNE